MVRAWALGLDRHQSISPKSSLAIATISEDADWWFPTPLIGVNEWPQMKNPLQVVFQGCEPSDQARAVVEREFERIEARDNRITSSRVTVIGPGDHHRHGAGFQIHILLTMPPKKTWSSTALRRTRKPTSTPRSRLRTRSRSPDAKSRIFVSRAKSARTRPEATRAQNASSGRRPRLNQPSAARGPERRRVPTKRSPPPAFACCSCPPDR